MTGSVAGDETASDSLAELGAKLIEHRGRIPSEGFRVREQNLIHQGSVVGFHDLVISDRNGRQFHRDVIRHPGAVSVVPFDGENVIMVQQYRASIDADMLEIPAGKRDVDGEPPERTAHRELAEEVGFKAESVELLANMHHSPGFCDEYGYVFLATGLSPVANRPEGPEEQAMSVHSISLDEAVAMCLDGRITDSKTLIGLLALAVRRSGGSS
jgi:ADP-ribose pyrophosphatase